MRTLLNGELLFPFEDEAGPNRALRSLEMGERPMIGSFVEKVLLYDRVVVPTVDMVAVPYLVYLVGLSNVLSMLESGALRFVRYKGSTMYLGGGAGLEMIEMTSPNNPPPGMAASREPRDDAERQLWRMQDAAAMPADEALHTVLEFLRLNDVVPGARESNLAQMALDRTIIVEAKELRAPLEQTYRDVLGHKHLNVLFSLRNSNLKKLLDLPGNQTRWLHERLWNDEIDVLLHLAQFNIEWYLANRSGCDDRTAGPSAYSFAHLRQGDRHEREELQQLLRLNRVPTLQGLATDDDALNAVLALRSSQAGENFRAWFHEAVVNDPDGVSSAYVDLLSRRLRTDGWPTKVLRFLSTTAVGLLAGAAGDPGITAAAVGAADALVVDRLVDGPVPGSKLFLQELREATGNLKTLEDVPE